MNTAKLWLNHKLVPAAAAKVSVWDRGFLYGDGIYETVRVYDGKIFRAEEHWRRLDHSLRGIYLKVGWSHRYLTRACVSVIQANHLKECLIRVTISRGSGKIGYDPSTCKTPTLVIMPAPIRGDLLELWENGVKIVLAKARRNHPAALNPAIKSTNCLNGIFAKIESLKKAAFEGVFLNLDGYLAEGTISNIFVSKDNVLKTPALKCGILDGVTRSAVIEIARAAGIKVMQTHIKPFELLNADENFLTSTTMEVMPVVRVDKKIIGGGVPGILTRSLQKKLRELIRKELRLK